jgi:hypothetical protein
MDLVGNQVKKKKQSLHATAKALILSNIKATSYSSPTAVGQYTFYKSMQ